MLRCLAQVALFASLFGALQVAAQEPLRLENACVGLQFDAKTGALVALENRLAGAVYQVRDDAFAVEGVEFRLDFADAKLLSLKRQGETVTARYEGAGATIEATYTLRGNRCFAEKQLAVTPSRDCGLKRIVVSRPVFSAADLRIVPYRCPKFGRKPGEEPTCVYFGRTPQGGFFTGLEMPFDASSVKGSQVVLAFMPSLKVAAGQTLTCEPAYFGVYRRQARDEEKPDLPLQSESDAMVAMTSAILGPPRFGLVPMACGWHSEMEHLAYTEPSVAGDMRSLDFLAECGVDWLSDSHPWGGERDKMNALGANDKGQPGPLVRRFLDHARKVGVKMVMWPTMNNTHPWGAGKPFRADKPDWLLTPGPSVTRPEAPKWLRTAKGNCLANKPFLDWLVRLNLEGMATGYYRSWAMDGDFFGGGGWYTSVIPVDCQSASHDHLPGDSNYACQRALDHLVASVRKGHPDTYLFLLRPPMDLGVWSLRNADVCFTLLESGTGKDNLTSGDHIRTWSRVRVHRDFFPHYLDQPLLFPSRDAGPSRPRNWPSGHIDYIMLSALSSSPNQLYYLPTKTGIPEPDKAELRKWLDWGRKNAEYLKVRKDLSDWPAPGKVDGSAHFLGDRGLVFLFNPDKAARPGEFALTEESIGLARQGTFQVMQEYPQSDRSLRAATGEAVRWEVPAETAVILRVGPAQP